MTAKEFESYVRGIAYHAEKFKRGKINGDELYEALQILIGKEAFIEAKEIMDENENK
ncbi:MAG: hypothetical protein FWG44_07885 [Oscillospiraceae bacterium]|nr:hypothetical protein [Oscillospiraceae bacterium]